MSQTQHPSPITLAIHFEEDHAIGRILFLDEQVGVEQVVAYPGAESTAIGAVLDRVARRWSLAPGDYSVSGSTYTYPLRPSAEARTIHLYEDQGDRAELVTGRYPVAEPGGLALIADTPAQADEWQQLLQVAGLAVRG
jgi:hypothetical protein